MNRFKEDPDVEK